MRKKEATKRVLFFEKDAQVLLNKYFPETEAKS
jgi:hypothetical protein